MDLEADPVDSSSGTPQMLQGAPDRIPRMKPQIDERVDFLRKDIFLCPAVELGRRDRRAERRVARRSRSHPRTQKRSEGPAIADHRALDTHERRDKRVQI